MHVPYAAILFSRKRGPWGGGSTLWRKKALNKTTFTFWSGVECHYFITAFEASEFVGVFQNLFSYRSIKSDSNCLKPKKKENRLQELWVITVFSHSWIQVIKWLSPVWFYFSGRLFPLWQRQLQESFSKTIPAEREHFLHRGSGKSPKMVPNVSHELPMELDRVQSLMSRKLGRACPSKEESASYY